MKQYSDKEELPNALIVLLDFIKFITIGLIICLLVWRGYQTISKSDASHPTVIIQDEEASNEES